MKEMTTRERFKRIYAHREADRIPILGAPWATTIERWRREGLPDEVPFTGYSDKIPREISIGSPWRSKL